MALHNIILSLTHTTITSHDSPTRKINSNFFEKKCRKYEEKILFAFISAQRG